MKLISRKDPYLKSGRLADVIAAVQVLAVAKRPERHIRAWAKTFDGNSQRESIDRWTKVFQEHPEFFHTYRLEDDPEPKAALRWRYAFKTVDPETHENYTPAQIAELPGDRRELLISYPLKGEEIQTLLDTAIGLHTRAIEELKNARWWVPIVAAFGGATLGALIAGALGLSK